MSSTPFADLIAQAAEVKYTVIPDDQYPLIVMDASDTMSSTGKDMLKLTVKVIGGPYADSKIFDQQTLSPENPNAIAIFLKNLAAFGIDEEFLASLPPREDGGPNFAAVAQALKGRVAIGKVGHHEWAGEDRNDVGKYFEPTEEQKAEIKAALSAAGVEGNPFAAPKVSADPMAGSGGAAGQPAF